MLHPESSKGLDGVQTTRQYQMGRRICLKAQVYFRTGEFHLQDQRAVTTQLQVSSTGKTKHSVSAELHMDVSEHNSVQKLHLLIILQMSHFSPSQQLSTMWLLTHSFLLVEWGELEKKKKSKTHGLG